MLITTTIGPGKGRGRVLRAQMLASGRLGGSYARLKQFDGWKIPLNFDEFSTLTLAKRTWAGRLIGLRLTTRMLWERLTRQHLLCRGAALQGRMLLLRPAP